MNNENPCSRGNIGITSLSESPRVVNFTREKCALYVQSLLLFGRSFMDLRYLYFFIFYYYISKKVFKLTNFNWIGKLIVLLFTRYYHI